MSACEGVCKPRLWVLPLTREWIEINLSQELSEVWGGSPSYEGVDWNPLDGIVAVKGFGSPSYEGVDWNSSSFLVSLAEYGSPSYEGVDWNDLDKANEANMVEVLPLTREWIEIGTGAGTDTSAAGSPSYEGVDWNIDNIDGLDSTSWFSLLRGSGLKSSGFDITEDFVKVLPLTREWIEISSPKSERWKHRAVLPLTREWIEISRHS